MAHEAGCDSVTCEPVLEAQGIYPKKRPVSGNNTLVRDEPR